MLTRCKEVLEKERENKFGQLKRSKIIFLSVASLFLVAGVGEGNHPLSTSLKERVPSVEKEKAECLQVLEKAEQRDFGKKEEYAYDPTGKADPFKPFIQLTRDKKAKGPFSPLQNYDLSQLKLVAIIKIPKGNIALVEDAMNKGYSLREGTPIGKNDGKVTKILEDRMVVEEVHENFLGEKKVHEVSLFLHRSEKEGGES